MKNTLLPGTCLALLLASGCVFAEGELKSGPQEISIEVKAFNPLHCSGSNIGQKNCLV